MRKLMLISMLVSIAGLILGGCGRKPWYRYYGMEEELETRSPDNMHKMVKAMEDGWCEGAEALGRLRAKGADALPDLEEAVSNNTCYAAGIKAIKRIRPDGPEARVAMLKAGQNGHCFALEDLGKEGTQAAEQLPQLFSLIEAGKCHLQAFKAALLIQPDSERLLGAAFRVIERTKVSKLTAWKSLRSQTDTLDQDYVTPLTHVVAAHKHAAVAQLVSLMGSQRWESRYCAARLLATTGSRDEKVIAAVDQAKKDKNEHVRGAAEAAYRKLKFTDIAAAEKMTIALYLLDPSGMLRPASLDQLADYLHAQMAAHPRFQLIPRRELRKQIKAQKVESFKAGFDESTQMELGKALAAQKSVVVRLLKMDAGCSITGTVFDLKKEATEKAATVDSDCTSDAFKGGMKKIAEKLAQGALK